MQGRRIPICQWVLGCAYRLLKLWDSIQDPYEKEGETQGYLEKIMAKSSPHFLPWLPSWEPHKDVFMDWGYNQRGRKEINQYMFSILTYRLPSMQMVQQLSCVELLTVKGFCICENAQVEE